MKVNFLLAIYLLTGTEIAAFLRCGISTSHQPQSSSDDTKLRLVPKLPHSK